MSSQVHTNNGPVPEFARKARQKREAGGGLSLQKGGGDGLLPAIHNPLAMSVDSAMWKGMAESPTAKPPVSIGFSAQPILEGATKISPQGTAGLRLKTENMGRWSERQSFLSDLDLDRREKELSLMRSNQHEANKLLLESWLNEVLDNNNSGGGGTQRTQTLQAGAQANKCGLSSYGLSRSELTEMGLVGEQIDRLYRSLYVYTVGFHDSLRSMFKHCKNPARLVENVWRSYIHVADAAIQVGFKSEFLALVATKEQSNSQLLMAEEALAATRKDQAQLEKSNTWLSGAHAQERAMRQSLEKEAEGLRTQLDKESREHSQLLTRYLSEVENRTQAQEENRRAVDELEKLRESTGVLERELAASKSVVQKLSVDSHTATRLAREAEALEAQTRSQREADKTRIADLNKRLATSWKEIETLRAELKEEMVNRKHVMEDIRIKQNAIAQQESIINDHLSFRHAHEQQRAEMQRAMQAIEEEKGAIEKERMQMQGVIDNLTAETDALQERLATKTMKKRDYKKSLQQLTSEHEEVKRAYMQHDQDRERERERMHELENELAEKTQECLEKEIIGYALNAGLAALTPVQWRSEAVIEYLRRVVSSGREEAKRLTGIIADRDHLIDTKRQEILKLNRVVRNNEIDIETLRERVAEITQELEETKQNLLDEEVLRRSETARLEREMSKQESVLKASRTAQENLKADVRQLKHEAEEAKRLASRVESDMHRMIDEQKNWRTEKFALEDRVHAATEDRLEMEKGLIKARSEAHNYLNEYNNTKKMLEHAKAAGVEDQKALDEYKKQLFRMKEEGEVLLNFMETMITKFKGLVSELPEEALNGIRRITPMKEDFQYLYERINQQGSALAQELSKERRTVEELTETIEKLRQEAALGEEHKINELKKAREAMEAQMAADEVARNELEAAKAELTTLLEAEEAAKNVALSKVEERDREIKGLVGDIQHQNKEKLDLQARMTILEANSMEEKTALEKQLGETVATLESEKAAHQETETALEQSSNTVTDRNVSMMQLRWRIKRLEDKMKRANDKLRNANSVRNYLQTEMGRLGDSKAKLAKQARELTELTEQQRAELQSLHMLMKGSGKEEQVEEFGKAMREKAEEIHELRVQLGDELDAKDERIRVLEEQLINTTSELEDANEQYKKAKAALESTRRELMTHNERAARQMEAARDELIQEMRSREEAMQKKMDKMRKAAEVAAEQYARETAEREYKASLKSMEVDAVPFARSGKRVVPAIRNVRTLVQTEVALKQSLSEVLFAASGPWLSLGQLEFRPQTLLVLVGDIMLGKTQRDLEVMQAPPETEGMVVQTVEEWTYDYFTRFFGLKMLVEAHLFRFVNGLLSNRYKFKRINMFGRLLGLFDPLPEEGIRFYINMLSVLYENAGSGLRWEHSEGKAEVNARTILGVLPDFFGQGTKAGQELPRRIMKYVKDDMDGVIDLDMALEWVMEAYETEMLGIETRVIVGFAELLDSGDPRMDFNVFRQAVEEFTICKDLKEIKMMYREVMAWVDSGNPLLEDTIIDVLQAHGFMGLRGSLRKPQKVQAPTKYDSYFLLEDSWDGVRPVLEAQVAVLMKEEANAESLQEVNGVTLQFEKTIRTRAQVENSTCWDLYRQILGAVVLQGIRIEVNEVDKHWKNPSRAEMRPTLLPASKHRRALYGQSPVKARTIEGIRQKNRENLERKKTTAAG